MSLFERKITNDKSDLEGEGSAFGQISERFLIVAPTFVICLANGLVLPQASGYQPKTWLSESFVHSHEPEFSPQANHTERSPSNRLKIHKIEPWQRQQQ